MALKLTACSLSQLLLTFPAPAATGAAGVPNEGPLRSLPPMPLPGALALEQSPSDSPVALPHRFEWRRSSPAGCRGSSRLHTTPTAPSTALGPSQASSSMDVTVSREGCRWSLAEVGRRGRWSPAAALCMESRRPVRSSCRHISFGACGRLHLTALWQGSHSRNRRGELVRGEARGT